jgi:MerR family transcriptional regulator, light-induced transcriptional regulator
MTDESSKKFNIQLAAQLSGLSAHTIRAWEKRYQALVPSRTANGRRLYTTTEIDRLIILAQLTQLGTNIGQIARLSDEELKETYAKLMQNAGLTVEKNSLKKEFNIHDLKSRLLEAVGNYNVDVISQLLSEAKNELPPKIFALDIIEPLITEVRLRRDQSTFQDAQAQALFALAKFHAGNIIYSHFEKGMKSANKIVLTSVEKEHHTFPLLISALLCCHHKKYFYYLNSNLPAPSIVDAVYATEANLLILSVPANSYEDQDVIKLLDTVIESLSGKIKIWLLGDFNNKLISEQHWKNTNKIKNHKELDEVLGVNS